MGGKSKGRRQMKLSNRQARRNADQAKEDARLQAIADAKMAARPRARSLSPPRQGPYLPMMQPVDCGAAGAALVELKVVNPRDNAKKLVDFLRQAHIVDSRSLNKWMPMTALALEDGAISPEMFCQAVSEHVYSVAYPSLETQLKTWEDLSDNRIEMISQMTNELIQMALRHAKAQDARVTAMPTSISLCDEFGERVVDRVRFFLRSNRCSFLSGPFGATTFYKDAIDQTCYRFANRLDVTFYRSVTGSFLQCCPVYNKSVFDYFAICNEMFEGTENCAQMELEKHICRVKRSLLAAAQGLAFSQDNAMMRCWECLQRSKKFRACEMCGVAIYCSEKCRDNAWDTGHLLKCADLEDIYESFFDNLNLMKVVHQTKGPEDSLGEVYRLGLPDLKPLPRLPNDLRRTKPNQLTDYSVFEVIADGKPFQDTEYNTLGVAVPEEMLQVRPTMHQFYRNVKAIANGRFWVFDTETDSDPAHEATVMTKYMKDMFWEFETHEDTLMAEEDYCLRIAYFLCFDVHSLTRHIDGGLENLGKAFGLQGPEKRCPPMPRQRFMTLYHKEPITVSGDIKRDALRSRRMKKVAAFAQMRKVNHK